MRGKRKSRYRPLNRKRFFRKVVLSAFPILIGGLVLTIFITLSTYTIVETQARKDFVFKGHEIMDELIDRLEDHALMLRGGVAYINLAGPVSRNDWKEYIAYSRIERYLPGVQGIGFVKIIPAEQLEQHVEEVRGEGFPDYAIFPSYEREVYTSILYVEPFTGRNLRAFGYDMFTEPVRRRAMEYSRDFDVALLSGRIRLEQDTGGEEIYGCFMFVPFYEPGVPSETTEQRRKAIRGWLYSPYRLTIMMKDIFEYTHQDNGLRVQLYDEIVADSAIMYDSHGIGTLNTSAYWNRKLIIPVDFNRNRWYLHFAQPRSFPYRSVISLFTGITISLLLFVLMKMFSKIESRSRQIRAQNKKLKSLNATKDKFFSIIAHDLKSPYNAVLGFSDILLAQVENLSRQEIQNIAGLIKKSANLAVELLMNLMVWSQSHTGKMKFVPEEVDVADLVAAVELLYTDMAAQKDIKLVNQLPEHVTVFADRAMLSATLRNLVSNAVKFTHPGGQITISAGQIEREVVISVADNGVGISQENIKKLFRIDESYTTAGTRKEKGTGLGLILCSEFVEKHGGRIWVESTPGKGSVFSFTIPDS